MGETPGERKTGQGGFEGGLATSALANSTAFGYSIMITVTFGAVTRIEGNGSILELLGFATMAALAVALINGVLTRGFRRRLEEAPAEIAMMGTAMNVFSVAASVAGALVMAELLPDLLGWSVAAFVASGLYVLLEGSEVLLAERIQAARGDPDADSAGSGQGDG